MQGPEQISTGLEAAFRKIELERMADLPILNPELRVQAVGFRQWQDYNLGVLITPWFMNLVLLPLQADEASVLQPGTKNEHDFPSGSYEFIAAHEDGIGPYETCSLFSPVFEFEDQAAAVATATMVMQGLMEDPEAEEPATADKTPGASPARKPISRRDLLRGAMHDGRG